LSRQIGSPTFSEIADLLTAAFVSDLSAQIAEYQPNLWIHGRVHSSGDRQATTLTNPHFLHSSKWFAHHTGHQSRYSTL